jgi:hypothetical protein
VLFERVHLIGPLIGKAPRHCKPIDGDAGAGTLCAVTVVPNLRRIKARRTRTNNNASLALEGLAA